MKTKLKMIIKHYAQVFYLFITNRKVKRIKVHVLEWLDKVNGNSYFAGEVIVYRKNQIHNYLLPFQYGYGEQYLYEAQKLLIEKEIMSPNCSTPLWRYCEENKIVLDTYKKENCLKRDLKNF